MTNIISFPLKESYVKHIFQFPSNPTIDDVISRQQDVERLLNIKRTKHESLTAYEKALFFTIIESHEFYWKRCIDAGVNIDIIMQAIKNLGGDEYITKRVCSYAKRPASLH